MKKWLDQNVLILGAARQGLALARFLAQQGAMVTLNDHCPPDNMQTAIQSMQDIPIKWVLGEHPLRLLDQTDLICVSGGVPLTIPIVVEAQRREIPLSNDSQIFMEEAPCPVIGITGSAGKTTTTILIGRIANAAIRHSRRVWVGGNIGQPLIGHVREIEPDDLVILELSSFQLELMTRVPQVGVVLNITPNHLDRHGAFAAYTKAKARILTYQNPQDCAVIGYEDTGAWQLADHVRGRLITFSFKHPPDGYPGTFLDNNRLFLFDGKKDLEIMPLETIQLRGDHNVLNVLAACAIAFAADLSIAAMAAGTADIKGIPHRLEFIRSWKGAYWYNDSIATAPERTMAAIRSFNEPLVVLLGGRDKDLPWDNLAALIHQRADHVILFGEAAEKIRFAISPIKNGQRPFSLSQCSGLKGAVQEAAAVVENGDVVLLSPGGTSYDEFKDFEERGECFREWVKLL